MKLPESLKDNCTLRDMGICNEEKCGEEGCISLEIMKDTMKMVIVGTITDTLDKLCESQGMKLNKPGFKDLLLEVISI